MADESLVTLADADALIAAEAVDYFNVRVSKCGGLSRFRSAIARRAAAAGIGLQVGSQVGETAILSAEAGRHLAAHLPGGSQLRRGLLRDPAAHRGRERREACGSGIAGEQPLPVGPWPRRPGSSRSGLRKYARRVVELGARGWPEVKRSPRSSLRCGFA